MKNFEKIRKILKKKKYNWVITGVAGFIGSNLLETLLKLDQKVIGADSLITGTTKNFKYIKKNVTKNQWKNFHFIKGDLKEYNFCKKICKSADFVLHQAALGSVPRSIVNPLDTNENNVNTFINIIFASMNSKVKNFVYASSSSVYGDNKKIPKVENNIGNQLSTYALTKYINELYMIFPKRCLTRNIPCTRMKTTFYYIFYIDMYKLFL